MVSIFWVTALILYCSSRRGKKTSTKQPTKGKRAKSRVREGGMETERGRRREGEEGEGEGDGERSVFWPEPLSWAGSWRWWRTQTSCARRCGSKSSSASTRPNPGPPPCLRHSSGTAAHTLDTHTRTHTQTHIHTNTQERYVNPWIDSQRACQPEEIEAMEGIWEGGKERERERGGRGSEEEKERERREEETEGGRVMKGLGHGACEDNL